MIINIANTDYCTICAGSRSRAAGCGSVSCCRSKLSRACDRSNVAYRDTVADDDRRTFHFPHHVCWMLRRNP